MAEAPLPRSERDPSIRMALGVGAPFAPRRDGLVAAVLARIRHDEGRAGSGCTTDGVGVHVSDGELAAAGTLALAFGWLPLLTAPNWSPKKRNARNTSTTKATTISKPRL